jgi:hypothetical protein
MPLVSSFHDCASVYTSTLGAPSQVEFLRRVWSGSTTTKFSGRQKSGRKVQGPEVQ